jgi:hypothetical protein
MNDSLTVLLFRFGANETVNVNIFYSVLIMKWLTKFSYSVSFRRLFHLNYILLLQ